MTKKPNKTKHKPIWEPRIPRALYTTGFNDIANRWHKRANPPHDLLNAIRVQMLMEGYRVSEGLIIAPSVCSHVFGENVVLCRLIDGFGVKGVEQLLEEGALQFILWKPLIVRFQEPRRGLDPIAAGNHNSPAHSDPQASVEMGLKGWLEIPWEKVRRIAKLAAERTHLPAENVSHDAVKAMATAYDKGALRKFGFNPKVPRWELSHDRITQLGTLAEDIAKGVVLHAMEFDVLQSALSWQQLLRMRNIVSANGAVESFEQGLLVANLPNIPMLMADDILKLQDIVKLRQNPATQELRKWLWEQPDPHNAEEVAKAWLATITDKPLKDRTWFKGVRLSAFSILGGIAGSLIGSPAGLEAGIAAGAALNQALGMVDTIGVEKLLSKPSPRQFADLLRQKMAEHKAPAQLPEGNRKERRAKKSKQRKPT